MSVFNDDEPILPTQDDSGDKLASFSEFNVGKTKAKIINRTKAPLIESPFKVMVELTGAGFDNDRPGVDLVMVLDISESMKGQKLAKMKLAMQFLIRKLSPDDRLSVVTFSTDAMRLCPLRQITKKSQVEIENLVNDLEFEKKTNITAGLLMGLKVLDERKLTNGRVIAIMLMSDGWQNLGDDATKIQVNDVPIYTFGFGLNHDPSALKTIADNSMGGTFSDVQNQNNLSIAFSQCLAGLLTVVVQDLQLTIKQGDQESTIEKVSAGSYPQSKNADSVTISFGDLYNKEVRKIIVDLRLPKVNEEKTGVEIVKITYKYRTTGGQKPIFEGNPLFATIDRVGTIVEGEREEVMVEGKRLETAGMMKDARLMADDNRLEDAKDMLVDAQNKLHDFVLGGGAPNPLIEMLKLELKELLRLMQSPEIYKKRGRPFALSSENSHARQRFAAKGRDVEKLRLFSTPRMNAYLKQAKAFDEDPSKALPTVKDDVKQELAADPFGPLSGALSYYIQIAIQALISVDKILNTSR
ncbi:Uncharacterized protein L484_010928 [Morus notabilis]|uniref:VWFA domain-containing protein n=1 Tax=Morus notabilis TaxID=981085 RepID=W9RIN2_9ROSA|nr:uncharacterized protein LOC21394208 [Morus notabilis]EXB93786.1 Uncharacterized protein L484_010928 [Morus notabilis]